MTGDLRLLPWRQLGINIGHGLSGLGLQASDFLFDVNARVACTLIGAVAVRRLAQLFNLAFEIGNRLFEVEENVHGAGGRAKRRARVTSSGMAVKSSAYGFSPAARL